METYSALLATDEEIQGYYVLIMTSRKGSAFRVTDPLGEISTDDRWILLKKGR